MTEKRFIINMEDECIDDAKEEIFIDFNDRIDFYKLCEFLNKLVDENEQLKQQIQQLQHWNNCLAKKRHQEQSYRPYTATKSEKELKELLESKLFNCSDR